MNPPSHCLECNAPLTAADAGGLCPKCLLRLGLASQFGESSVADAGARKFVSPPQFPFDFGGYRVLRLLGRGGMGAVYEAEQRETGRRVALKVLGQTKDTPEMRARFLREGQLAAAVRHPNTVAVFAAEEVEGTPVIAMELVPDGTLKDRVKRAGPLPVVEAVDAVLQIVDGLEAAHAGGVLHRDVKPANCFVSPDGTTKIGDFGLSISTLVKAEQQLTQTGAVLGTPAFASPEQLRAQEIDVRSDIYSVGATLYFLLTGKPTHDAGTLVALIAAVLERDPVEPATLRPELPAALSRIVMRCLARQATARFGSYEELRNALLPFRSAAASPATLGLRLLAGLIDGVVMALPWIACELLGRADPVRFLVTSRSMEAAVVFFGVIVWGLLCVSVPEGRWGMALGKKLTGLRVVRVGGSAPGLMRSLARGMIFGTAHHAYVAILVLMRSAAEYADAATRGRIFPEEMFEFYMIALLFITVRRRNGYAAFQDLVTKTRVVLEPSVEARCRLSGPLLALPTPMGGKVGPFSVCGKEHNVVVALDEALRRRVWVLSARAGDPSIGAARRDLSRPGRLRWLNGRRSAGENWDAFEAPDGVPLSDVMHRRHPWGQVRAWLFDLADEFRAGLDEGTLPEVIGFDRVWLTRDGRAVLLDFPAPGATPQPGCRIVDQTEAQVFLADVAAALLETPAPLHAHDFLKTLRAGRFESMALAAGNLQAALERPAAVTTRRRLLSLAAAPVCALIMALVAWWSIEQETARFDSAWQQRWPNLPSLRTTLALVDALPGEAAEMRRAYRVLLAAKYRDAISDREFWDAPFTVATLTDTGRDFAEQAVKETSTVSPEELSDATKLTEAWSRTMLPGLAESHFGTLAGVFFLLLTVLAIAGFAMVGFAGWVASLRMADLAVITRDGVPAGRMRLVWRSVIGLIPLFLALVVTVLALRGEATSGRLALAVPVAVLAYLGVMLFAALRPRRAIADHLAGTFIVRAHSSCRVENIPACEEDHM